MANSRNTPAIGSGAILYHAEATALASCSTFCSADRRLPIKATLVSWEADSSLQPHHLTQALYLYCSMMLLPEASSAVRPAKAPSIASLQLITCSDRGAHGLSYELGHRMSSQLLRSQVCCLVKAAPTTSDRRSISARNSHLGCGSLEPEGIWEADWQTGEAALVLQYCHG